MPRGVYDRTKSKEQRAAEKAKGAAPKKAAPKKEAKKAAAPKNTASAVKGAPKKHYSQAPKISTNSKLSSSELDVGTKFAIVRENIGTLVGAINGLTLGAQQVISHPVGDIVVQLDDELKANISVLSDLRREVFGLSDSEKEAEETKSDPETEEPVAAAPQPVVPAQPGTVPMPPIVPPGMNFTTG